MNVRLVTREQIETAFHAAQECALPGERERYLQDLGTNDPELQREVAALLRSAEVAGVIFPADDPAVTAAFGGEQPGAVIGRYRLIQKIGEGGMGAVFLAEQQEPVRRHVALKVIKLGMDTRQVVARFEAERQALALMDHPNIAHVLDGGATDTGRPYFVMELVHGVPITEFCDQAGLSPRERIKLLIPVCHAIQSAHQKGIIHRDIKPTNVLVTQHDPAAAGVPKVIDFGIAKATEGRLTDNTVYTQLHQFIGTPAYMSPEQAEMSGLDVDTRTDIYALGVLLYELLTGTTPFPEQRLRRLGYAEMQRVLLEEEPERPSARWRRLRETGKTKADDAGSGLHLARAEIDPDLDWIVTKCLEKDRTRRYETVNALAADLGRFLDHEPILARAPGAMYRLRKGVRRHRLACAAAAAVLLTLVAGIVATSWQAWRARRERARAEHRLEVTVQLVSEAFEHVFPSLVYTIGMSQPQEDLAKAAARMVEDLLQDATPSPEMRRAVGQLYLHLAMVQAYYDGNTTGDFAEGRESARKAITFFQPSGPEPVSDDQLRLLSWAEMFAGFAAQGLLQPEEALVHFGNMQRQAGTLAQSADPTLRDRGLEEIHWAKWLTGETLLRLDRTDEALTNYFRPLLGEIKARVAHDALGRQSVTEDLRDAHDSIGRCLARLGRREEAESDFRAALPLAEHLAGENPSHSGYGCYLAESKARLGEALLVQGRPAEALPLLESASQHADSLQRRDPANPGFVQLKVKIRQAGAAGWIGWADDHSASVATRTERLDRAREFLEQAEQLIAGLKSETFRRFLRQELRRTTDD